MKLTFNITEDEHGVSTTVDNKAIEAGAADIAKAAGCGSYKATQAPEMKLTRIPQG